MKYPFTPAALDAMPEEVAEIFRSLELVLLDEICSRLNTADALNEVTLQDIRVLRSHGIDIPEIKEAIKKSTAIGEEKLNAVIDDAVERNKAYYGEAATLSDVTIPQMLLSDADIDTIRRQTNKEYTNITQSMGFLVDSGRTMLPPAKAYQWAIDNAAIQIQSGGISYNEAIKNAVKQLADSGIKTVDYESGHVDHVDVAVRRAVMTAVNQLNRRYEEQAMEYLKTDLVEVSAHQGARDIDGPMGWENHKAWQGKVYRWKQYPKSSEKEYPDFEETCGYGDVTGILGANCRHSFAPFIEGVSERTYTDEQLAKIDPPPFEYEGRTYTAYEATQMQRRVERTMRKLQREETAYTASGNNADAQLVHIRKNRLSAKYHEFSAKAGLPEQPERMKAYDKKAKTDTRSMAMGLRQPETRILTQDEIASLIYDAKSIKIDVDVLRFNEGSRTGYYELENVIFVRGDVLPDLNSKEIRDIMSQRAVLAHEYYGHLKSNPSSFKIGDWRDEFFASYNAAINTPNLSDEERGMLMMDAYNRAKEAGKHVEYSDEARKIIYGFE